MLKIKKTLDINFAEKAPEKVITAEIICTNAISIKENELLNLVKLRPFDEKIDLDNPKKLFINAMNTAPNQANAKFYCKQNKEFFCCGYEYFRKICPEILFFCSAGDKDFWVNLGVTKVTEVFGGHPAGNSSVHIASQNIDLQKEQVWVVRAVDLFLIGEFFMWQKKINGRLVAISGIENPGYYFIKFGTAKKDLQVFFNAENRRLIFGNVLTGNADLEFFPFDCVEINFLDYPEKPKLFNWIHPKSTIIDCAKNGGERAAVFSGFYDKVQPLNVKMDYLLRAVLAQDWRKSVSLGLFDLVAEDVALCEYICPSKLPLQEILVNAQKSARKLYQ